MTQQPPRDQPVSFRDVTLVACGTLRRELQALTEDGRLDAGRVLAISDWMGLPMEAAPISLDRFHGLLVEAARRAAGGA